MILGQEHEVGFALIAPLDGLDAVKNLQIIHDILYEHEKL